MPLLQDDDDDSHARSSDLYLVAFLATLLLLLLVSTGVFTRAYLHRRTLRAIARLDTEADALRDAQARHGRAKGRLNPPLLSEVWFVKLESIDHDGPRWDQLMPVAAQSILTKKRRRHKSGMRCQHNHVATPSARTPGTPSHLRSSSGLLGTMSPCVKRSSKALSEAPLPSSTRNDQTPLDLLQVSVLIRMPSPHPSCGRDDERPILMLGSTCQYLRHPDHLS